MRIRSVLLAAFLFTTAITIGLLLPMGMTWFQSATTPKTVEYPVEHVNLEYAQQVQLVEKYRLMATVENTVMLDAGHTSSVTQIQNAGVRFLETAFPMAESADEAAVEPALIVSDGQAVNVWYYHNVYTVASDEMMFSVELVIDDATGAVLCMKMDASMTGLLPVLCRLCGLPDDYWQNAVDSSELMQTMAENFKHALENEQEGLQVTVVNDYLYAPAMPSDPYEPIFFSQRLILEQGEESCNMELWAEEFMLRFNCY